MTRTPHPPTLLLIALIFTLSFITTFARGHRAPARAARQERRARPSARESRRERAADRRGRREENARGRGGHPLSKRERLAQARREAEERRRREEAARRAELARLAAIARQRAIEQAMRNEVAANIAKDDKTGEDLEVRQAAVNALGNRIGSVVVMDPKTGRVYSIVNQEWGVRRGFKPCSTIKLVTGLAGLGEHVIDPVQELNVSLNSNQIDLTDALAFSNNGYFQNVGGRVGFDRMVSYARQLGLGERTGVNHANEYSGRVPLFKNGYAVNHMSSHGDDFEVTPLQLATLASVFANGGTLLTPHLPRTPEESINFKTEVRRQLNLPQDNLRRMLPGMIGAVNYGSGRKAYDPTETIAGKTGTCIGANGQWVGLFTSYAPVEDPHLAIAVITRGPDARAHVPAAIAGNIYRQLENRFGKSKSTPLFALTPDILKPHPKVDAATAARLNEEDAEANAAANAETANPDPNLADTNANANVKPALHPVQITTPNVMAQPPVQSAVTTTTPGAKPQQPTTPGEARPRRVTNKPQ